MSERYYPPIDERPLLTARALALEDPNYLTEAPYSEELKALLGKRPEAVLPEAPGERDLEAEVDLLYEQLREFKESLDPSDRAELNTYFRVAAGLLEKLVTLKERAAGVSQVKAFTGAVLEIMADELEPDQRTRIIRRLGHIIGETS